MIPESGTTPDPTKEELAAALESMRAKNDRAENARLAYFATPRWHLWRHRKAWREWKAAVDSFVPYAEELRIVQSSFRNPEPTKETA